MEKRLLCTSCKKDITNMQGSVIFKCPACGKEEVIRCVDCRKNGATYKCLSCGFSGPN